MASVFLGHRLCVSKSHEFLGGGRVWVKQAESSKTKTNGSKVVVVPVQQEKAGSKTTPKNGAQPSKADQSAGMSPEDDLSSRIEKQERLFQSEKSNLEELHRSKVRALEEQVNRCKDQLKSQKKDSDAVAAESKKALADVKSRYERELATWNKERETMNKNDKQVSTRCVISEIPSAVSKHISSDPVPHFMFTGAKCGNTAPKTVKISNFSHKFFPQGSLVCTIFTKFSDFVRVHRKLLSF